ncbi:MAG: hypothetical protein HDKAJFGB_01472 [Anaerolineae bacterium]|nr:hypothetical protein [Anaerolineae bacterium]
MCQLRVELHARQSAFCQRPVICHCRAQGGLVAWRARFRLAVISERVFPLTERRIEQADAIQRLRRAFGVVQFVGGLQRGCVGAGCRVELTCRALRVAPILECESLIALDVAPIRGFDVF